MFLGALGELPEDIPTLTAYFPETSKRLVPHLSFVMVFAAALRKVGVRFELHIYEQAGHGIGLGGEPLPHRRKIAWLSEQNFIK